MARERSRSVIRNRSIPAVTVIPELSYDDVATASDWLCKAFGFTERIRIGAHRAQLLFGDGAIVVKARGMSADAVGDHSVLVRVADADTHHARAKASGARILQEPTDHPYGERQYTCEDIGGHVWTFTESIADVDPASWGATRINLG
jgi:uncharacterized glyoxalase superfamily protein PhnB